MSLQPTARPSFVALVEDHLTALVRSAVTVQRHCKRARLMTSTTAVHGGSEQPTDSSAAAQQQPPVTTTATTVARLHAADVNLALQLQGSEKLYGIPCAVGQPDANAALQAKVTLQDLLRQDHQYQQAAAAPPHEVALHQQWLAVDGEAPDAPAAASTAGQLSSAAASSASSIELLRVHQLQAGLLSEELKLYYTRLTTTLDTTATTASGSNYNHAADEAAVDAVLQSVATDSGLQELVPFLVRYAQSTMYHHLSSASNNNNSPVHGLRAVRLARALLDNRRGLHLEWHLHELLPALLTCVVTPSRAFQSGNPPRRRRGRRPGLPVIRKRLPHADGPRPPGAGAPDAAVAQPAWQIRRLDGHSLAGPPGGGEFFAPAGGGAVGGVGAGVVGRHEE